MTIRRLTGTFIGATAVLSLSENKVTKMDEPVKQQSAQMCFADGLNSSRASSMRSRRRQPHKVGLTYRSMSECYSPHQFAIFRILFGLHLAVMFFENVPYSAELFGGSAYSLVKADIRPLPNLLTYVGHPAVFLLVLALLSCFFAAGIFRRVASVLIWYGLYCLFHQNVHIDNISLSYTGWLLLACTLVPTGEPLCVGRRYQFQWRMPQLLLVSAWLILAVSYAVAGATKLNGALWMDGRLLAYLLESAMARDWWFDRLLLRLPASFLKLLTWSVVACELSFLPLCLFNRTRFYAWVLLTIMNIGIMLTMDFAQLNIAILLFHLFVFDSRWIRRHAVVGRRT